MISDLVHRLPERNQRRVVLADDELPRHELIEGRVDLRDLGLSHVLRIEEPLLVPPEEPLRALLGECAEALRQDELEVGAQQPVELARHRPLPVVLEDLEHAEAPDPLRQTDLPDLTVTSEENPVQDHEVGEPPAADRQRHALAVHELRQHLQGRREDVPTGALVCSQELSAVALQGGAQGPVDLVELGDPIHLALPLRLEPIDLSAPERLQDLVPHGPEHRCEEQLVHHELAGFEARPVGRVELPAEQALEVALRVLVNPATDHVRPERHARVGDPTPGVVEVGYPGSNVLVGRRLMRASPDRPHRQVLATLGRQDRGRDVVRVRNERGGRPLALARPLCSHPAHRPSLPTQPRCRASVSAYVEAPQ